MFRFKQFTICDERCAMKVGTDGVLLGSWANCEDAQTILDVGTGSGLIALMLAQRSGAVVKALDLDEGAFLQASLNVARSPFSGKTEVIHSSYQQYFPGKKFDLIVSNPPYFSRSLKSPDIQRTNARHNDTLSLEELVKKSVSLLPERGKLALILLAEAFPVVNEIAAGFCLHLVRKTWVKPTPDSLPKRVLLEYSFLQTEWFETELIIEISRHVYSQAYISLTKDFYLNM